ncbi:MAG: hypothetical protein WKG06_23995 [Segetibacter sp.]
MRLLPVPVARKMSGVPGAGACITSCVAVKSALKGTVFWVCFALNTTQQVIT